MKKYIVPRNKRRHLVVEEDVHSVVCSYASQQNVSLVEATYRLLKLGICQAYDLTIPDDEIDQYMIKKPIDFDLRNWLRRMKR